MRRRLFFLVPIIGLVLYGAAVASPATAKTTAPAGRNCVARALPAGSSQRPVAKCYATFSRAILAATSGRVHLPASARPGSVSLDKINAAAATPATTFVISIDWVNSNFGGSTLTWTESSKCGSFSARSMPSGWNDVISSVEAFSGCANTLYKNNNFGTPAFNIVVNGSVGSLGSFNDVTSSQKWCRTFPCG